MNKNLRKAILKKASRVHIYVWIEGEKNTEKLSIAFTDRNDDEFFKLIYLLTDGRSIEDNKVKETVRFVINTHISKDAEVNITFWKYKGYKKYSPSEQQLKFKKQLISFIRDNKIGPPIKVV